MAVCIWFILICSCGSLCPEFRLPACNSTSRLIFLKSEDSLPKEVVLLRAGVQFRLRAKPPPQCKAEVNGSTVTRSYFSPAFEIMIFFTGRLRATRSRRRIQAQSATLRSFLNETCSYIATSEDDHLRRKQRAKSKVRAKENTSSAVLKHHFGLDTLRHRGIGNTQVPVQRFS
jgi:hypothetical protein